MRFSAVATLLAAAQCVVAAPSAENWRNGKIAPKVMIVSLFDPEAEIWYENLPDSGLGNLLDHNITAPGLSMLFPHIHCVDDFSICQLITGESEINAAATVMAAVLSGKFDFSQTYFMIAGIAGVSPKHGALGSVALSRFTVQVALQYEIDPREMPANWSIGYFGYHSEEPGVYPGNHYGSEVFELNINLRDAAFEFASRANLSTDPIASAYGELYVAEGDAYAAAAAGPSVIRCDSATSDVYYSGTILSTAFENVTKLWTNGTGEYCMTAQEDAAVLEVLVRLGIEGLVDFSRAILMRTGSDFDRQPPGITAFDNLRTTDQNGFDIAVDNIYNTGVEIIKGILDGWDDTFCAGIKPDNYIGDIFGSLGGEPDFGPGSVTDGEGYLPGGRSSVTAKSRRARMAKRGIIHAV